jgi:hypothetical protein
MSNSSHSYQKDVELTDLVCGRREIRNVIKKTLNGNATDTSPLEEEFLDL